MSPSVINKIDVHHHFVPDKNDEAMAGTGGDSTGRPTPKWSEELSEKMMGQLGTTTAILSLTLPGAMLTNEDSVGSARIARNVNQYLAKIRDEKPNTFGFFATLPSLMHTDATIQEIRYAFDELKADGVCLYTRYGKGYNYLGHEHFRPVWAELNAHRAVVLIHPTEGADPGMVNATSPQPLFDYPHETLRTAMDMILYNTKRDNPDCKVILSHGGGTLPYILGRVSGMYEELFPFRHVTEAQIIEDAKSFYFDLALSTSKEPLQLLLDWAHPDHILFGSDFPYAPGQSIVNYGRKFEEHPIDEGLRKKICYENAWKLFPRLAPKEGEVEGGEGKELGNGNA